MAESLEGDSNFACQASTKQTARAKASLAAGLTDLAQCALARHHPCFSQIKNQMSISLMICPQFSFGVLPAFDQTSQACKLGVHPAPNSGFCEIQLLRSTGSIPIANLNVQLNRMDQSPQPLQSSNVQHQFSLEKSRRV